MRLVLKRYRITDALGAQDTRPESGDEGDDDSEQES